MSWATDWSQDTRTEALALHQCPVPDFLQTLRHCLKTSEASASNTRKIIEYLDTMQNRMCMEASLDPVATTRVLTSLLQTATHLAELPPSPVATFLLLDWISLIPDLAIDTLSHWDIRSSSPDAWMVAS